MPKDRLVIACAQEFDHLIAIGNWFLLAALIAAVALTLLSVIERIMALGKTPSGEGGGGGDPSTLLDSIKGLVTALAQAPAWFAIFLAAILLLWAAPTFFGAQCSVAVDAPAPGATPTPAPSPVPSPVKTPVKK